jgi:hypothetical protein
VPSNAAPTTGSDAATSRPVCTYSLNESHQLFLLRNIAAT